MIGFIQGAVNDGAEILCGGKIPKLDSKLDKGYFLEPTVLGGTLNFPVVQLASVIWYKANTSSRSRHIQMHTSPYPVDIPNDLLKF